MVKDARNISEKMFRAFFSPGFGPLVTPEPPDVVVGPEVGEPENVDSF